MDLDASSLARWIEPLAREPGEIADLFAERRRQAILEWRDGELTRTQITAAEGLSVRQEHGGRQRLVFLSRADETAAREALRELQSSLGHTPLPIRTVRQEGDEPSPPLPVERWRRRLAAVLGRHAPRHQFRWTLREVTRLVVPARGAASTHARRLVSLEGTFTAASRRGDETRAFCFHCPESETTLEELKALLAAAAAPREPPVPCPEGETDAVLAGGCAAVLFHEILSHPLEAGTVSPLSALSGARLAVPDLEARDDATRLDLFGGYERDDEGVRPRPVKLLDGGRLAGRLTCRGAAQGEPSSGHGRRAEAWDPPLPRGSNLVVAAGQATRDEMARRLNNGLWIEDLDGGSVELASGRFYVRFPRARRVRRGRLADELSAGVLAGEIVGTLKGIEGGLGRQSRPYRALGWCAARGQVVPVQGAAPDVLIRGLAARAIA